MLFPFVPRLLGLVHTRSELRSEAKQSEAKKSEQERTELHAVSESKQFCRVKSTSVRLNLMLQWHTFYTLQFLGRMPVAI